VTELSNNSRNNYDYDEDGSDGRTDGVDDSMRRQRTSVTPSPAVHATLRNNTHVVLMRDDMASGSVSRSLNGQAKRSLRKVRDRGPKSSADSMEDSSRESSVASSVTGRISRKQAAPQPLV
jgi:hypothetical protein